MTRPTMPFLSSESLKRQEIILKLIETLLKYLNLILNVEVLRFLYIIWIVNATLKFT